MIMISVPAVHCCNSLQTLIIHFLLFSFILCNVVSARTRYFNFNIQYTNATRLCYTKSLYSVNGQFPGPTMYVREGDKVVVNVTNFVPHNVTIHWHGVLQTRSAWADGPAYITQCPIQTNQFYVHRFQVTGQRGTLFWHAHLSWLRATLYGAFIILKKNKTPYPFPKPDQEAPPVLLGEWWNANVEDVISQALVEGGSYNISDALTINGQPGDLYNCSADATVVYNVTQGETILLRIINAALNFHMFFAVANHSLMVVEVDADYTEPFITDVILLAPGQTTNVLLTASNPIGQYYMSAAVFSPPNSTLVPFPGTPTTAILSYSADAESSNMVLPIFPAVNDTSFQANFTHSLRSLTYFQVPQSVDVDLLHTLSYDLQSCPAGKTCQGPNNTIIRTSISNFTFVTPNVSLLQAHFNHISGLYTTDFPDVPLFQYNYTGVDPTGKTAVPATRVRVFAFNTSVQVVYQDTATLFFESHPIHIHGHSFYIVGTGSGNYHASTDSAHFNLVNPVSRNTVSVPPGGWAAIRFRAINPGVWFVHCHYDIHLDWGMSMAFITLNGERRGEWLPEPPADLPAC